jgi:hypothetical protein
VQLDFSRTKNFTHLYPTRSRRGPRREGRCPQPSCLGSTSHSSRTGSPGGEYTIVFSPRRAFFFRTKKRRRKDCRGRKMRRWRCGGGRRRKRRRRKTDTNRKPSPHCLNDLPHWQKVHPCLPPPPDLLFCLCSHRGKGLPTPSCTVEVKRGRVKFLPLGYGGKEKHVVRQRALQNKMLFHRKHVRSPRQCRQGLNQSWGCDLVLPAGRGLSGADKDQDIEHALSPGVS